MPHYEVTLRPGDNPARSVRTVRLIAPSEALAWEQAGEGDWIVSAVRETAAPPPGLFGFRRGGLIKGKRLITMCRTMGAMLKSGLKIEEAIEFYARGLTDRDLAFVLSDIRRRIEREGQSVHRAFAETARFDPQFLAIVQAASQASALGSGFRRIADRLAKAGELKAGLVRELSMPVLALGILIVVFVGSQYGVTNTMTKIVDTMRLDPGPVLGPAFAIGKFVRNYWPLGAAGAGMFAAAMVLIPSFRTGFVDFFVARSKVVRNMVEGLRQLTILHTMDLLLNCYGLNHGLTPAEALKAAGKVAVGTRFEKELARAYVEYNDEGQRLGVALEKHTSLDRQITHLIGVGEPTSTVGEQVSNLIEMYNDITRDAIDIFQRAVIVLVLLVTAGLILIVAISVVFPLVLLGPQMSNGGVPSVGAQ